MSQAEPAAQRRMPRGAKTLLKIVLPLALLALAWHWLLRLHSAG